jgi:hypothetical protein
VGTWAVYHWCLELHLDTKIVQIVVVVMFVLINPIVGEFVIKFEFSKIG